MQTQGYDIGISGANIELHHNRLIIQAYLRYISTYAL
jgi:hypothetical protein